MFLFGNFTPTLDVWSDFRLSVDTLSFNLGKSLELSGCRVCHSNAKYRKLDGKKPTPQICISSPMFSNEHASTGCFRFTFTIDKIIDMLQSPNNEAWVFKNLMDVKGQRRSCNNGDLCCIQTIYNASMSNSFESGYRATTYNCKKIRGSCFLCNQALKASILYCDMLWTGLKTKRKRKTFRTLSAACKNNRMETTVILQ